MLHALHPQCGLHTNCSLLSQRLFAHASCLLPNRSIRPGTDNCELLSNWTNPLKTDIALYSVFEVQIENNAQKVNVCNCILVQISSNQLIDVL